MNKSTSLCNEAIIRQMARIHPMSLYQFLSSSCAVFIALTEDTPEHPVLHALASLRTIDELAQVNWKAFRASLVPQTDLPPSIAPTIIDHIALFIERMVLHHQLYFSKSASTLRLLKRCKLPPSNLPNALAQAKSEFEQFHAQADHALQRGRGLLQAFQCKVQEEASISCLQALLDQARSCYDAYCQALQQADELVGYIYWYLSWEAGNAGGGQFHAA